MKMRTRFQLNVTRGILFLCLVAPAWAADIYVDSDAPGTNNGSSWLNAFNYLQDGLVAARPGDTIKVAQGVYTPDQGIGSGEDGRFASFALKPEVRLMGGFAGYSVLPTWQWDNRNPQLYVTVLSGDLSGNDSSIDPNDHEEILRLLSAPSRADNSYNVVTLSNTSRNTLLEGFTITGGNANGLDDASRRGGGIVASTASATVRDCTITACSAFNAGGGMYTYMGDPKVDGCTFVANYAENSGAGIYNWGADPNISACVFEHNVGHWQCDGGGIHNYDSNSVIVDCTFRYNDNGKTGGGIYNYQSDPNIANCVFVENAVRTKGGAIYNAGNSHPLITNCQFKRNTTLDNGGAVASDDSFPRFTGCIFINNESEEDGGAIYNRRSDPNLFNCLFNGNEAGNYGGGVFCYDANALVINCTFANNRAISGRGLACSSLNPPRSSSDVVVTNCIFWDDGAEIYNTDSSQIVVSYTHIFNNWPGKENENINPKFADDDGPDYFKGTEDDDLRLDPISGCIDSGNNDAVPFSLLTDLEGKPRFMDYAERPDEGKGIPPLVDRGAYEFGDVGGLNPPVAHAGLDQTASAPPGGQADVQLNGSGSHDPDGDSLQYAWTWPIGQQMRQATGVRPTVQLPIGQHLVRLVVFDGIFYSQPSEVLITVLDAGHPPTAHAGADQTIVVPGSGQASVTLDGSGSQDADGDPLQYAWNWTVSAQSFQATGVNPIIQLPIGQHLIHLVVFDGTFYSPEDTVLITVTTPNRAPIAHAGPDQTVTVAAGAQANVNLDSSASYDPDGDSLLYTWTVGGQTYQTSIANPTIQLPVGQHVLELVVNDGILYSTPDTVVITVTQGNQSPVANAGPDQSVVLPGSGYVNVTLNGSGSYDPDGDALQRYTWSWVINNQTHQSFGVSPTIQLPLGQHSIELVVFDGTSNSVPDSVLVTVSQSNRPPIAHAGPDQALTASGSGLTSVRLDGSGSYDLDGDPLTYVWTWRVSGQPYQTSGVKPVVQLPPGQHTISLVVHDGQVSSSPDTVVITITQGNRPPIANAGPDQNVTASAGGLTNVRLDGSGSYDPDGDTLTYLWNWTVGNQARQASGVNPLIQLPVGQHVISLVVHDGQVYSTVDRVTITVSQGNRAPVANAGPDQTVTASAGGLTNVRLNGSGSSDPDGDPLTYLWNWTVGNQARQASGVNPLIQLPAGQHIISLVVHDGQVYSAADTVTITVSQGNRAPVAHAGPDQTVSAAAGGLTQVVLDGSGSYDLDGDSLVYIWNWTVANQPFQASGVNPSIQLPTGQHIISLVVHDGQVYSSADSVTITVSQANRRPVADAGPDQTVHAPTSGQASVLLDGSGSHDPDGAGLQYTWSWNVGAWSYQTTGVNPTIQLPLGQHTISLVVSDGVLNSLPDTVLITVTQANQPPVADAGPDQAKFTAPGDFAHVTLDGSGSVDPEGSSLQYTWSWTVGSQAFQVTGVNPVIQLPVGQYTIKLVVFDGILYSAPDQVSISVDAFHDAPLWLSPYNVNRHDMSEYILGMLKLNNVLESQVDLSVPLVLYPSGVEARFQHTTQIEDNGTVFTTVFVMFAEEDVLNAVPQDGLVPLTIWGQLTSGEPFSGTDTVVLTH